MLKRKTRTDRNHAIYAITNNVTGEFYIGVTVCSGNINKALKVRFQKHVRRALTENKAWALCANIREFGAELFTYHLLEKVRGKADAHARERELTRELQPTLNTL
jgi:predicted GIY-YIG superfamily endonuclease